eukprot:7909-Heterococcus_DN1.PRE.2
MLSPCVNTQRAPANAAATVLRLTTPRVGSLFKSACYIYYIWDAVQYGCSRHDYMLQCICVSDTRTMRKGSAARLLSTTTT